MSDGSKKFYFLLQNHMALYKGADKVAGSAGAGFSPENAGTTGQVLTKTATGYNYQDAPSELPSSGTNGQYLQKTANGPVWADVEALPSGGTVGQVLTKTASGADWETPAAGGIICDPNSPISIEKIWVGTEQQYSELSSYNNNTAYLTV